MPTTESLADGVHGMVPPGRMDPLARRRRETYAITPDVPLIRGEFWLMSTTLEEWKRQGMPQDVPYDVLFHYDPNCYAALGDLGWCEAAFVPGFESRVIEDRGDTEVVQDGAGRHVLFFKGRREGFMPQYVDHPVKDQKTWERDVKWRLDPKTPERWQGLDQRVEAPVRAAEKGFMIAQHLIGGYMYLRSLMGPEQLLYFVHDQPALIHDCMRTWFDVADAVIARHQQYVTFDELFFAEDICYNHGPLISPAMMKEFLLPYYQQLIANLKRRQLDRTRHLYVQVDTDGDCRPVIPIYMQATGMDAMSPFEVASGCDVVEIGRQYPNLMIRGGLDKRVLARSKRDIDEMVERILPAMRRRGGYIPCIDHGVPKEVPYENYLHFRKRCVELGGG